MCVVSMINDYGRERIQPWKWTPKNWVDYQELVKKAEEVDKALEQPDCDDPQKLVWTQDIQKQIDEVEAKKSIEDKKLEALKRLQKNVDDAHKQFNIEMDKINDKPRTN